MAQGVGELNVTVVARTRKAIASVKRFRKSINRLPRTIGIAARSIGGLTAGLGALAGVAGVGYKLQQSFAGLDNLAKTSDKLGIATEALAGLRLAAEETGVASNTLDLGIQRMVRRVAEAAQGTGEAQAALRELGLGAKRLAALSPDQQFREIARAMEGVATQSDKVRLGFKLFDSEGVALVNTLRLGAEGLDQTQAAAERLGLAINRVDAAAIERANDSFGRFRASIDGLFNKAAVGIAPLIERLSKRLTEWGVSGQISSQKTFNGLEMAGRGVGVLLDVVDTTRLAFLRLQAFATEAMARIVSGANSGQVALVELINKIPGVEIKASTFLQSLADEMNRTAKTLNAKFDKSFLADPPSAKIKSFFAGVREEARKSAEVVDKALAGQQSTQLASKAIAPAAQYLGQLLSRFSVATANGIQSGVRGSVATLNSMSSRNRQGDNRILNANTAEGFAALRSSMRGENIQKRILDKQEDGNKLMTIANGWLEAIAEATKQGGEVFSFNEA